MEGFNATYSDCVSQPCPKSGIREFISKSVSFGLLDYFIFFTNEIIGKSQVSIYHVILHYGVRAFYPVKIAFCLGLVIGMEMNFQNQ